ncbi:MAG: sulfatase-like hydrolase/transferase [Lentimonas sp.]
MRHFLIVLWVFCLISAPLFASIPENYPNILWLTSEDNSIKWIGCYGNPNARTPNIDQLAVEGFRYTNAYASAPVCAPSRSTWITGINAISMGTHPMRSRYDIPHDQIAYYPDLLKANGYHVGNSRKTDYNIGGRNDKDCWDNSSQVDWKALTQKQPFFQVINFSASHESKAFGAVDRTKHDPAQTALRAYHPDLPEMRQNYAHYHDAIAKMDTEIGVALRKLEASGMAENTIVIYNSDHGGVLPRSKRYLFSSGLHCPLIIRIPEKYKAFWPASQSGTPIDRLVSYVDMPKTWLGLTDTPVPEYMQGTTFLGDTIEPEPPHCFSFRGRMDERNENARAITDGQYLYIRNYMPYTPWMQHLNYLWKMKATQVWVEHVESGNASEVEARFFKPKGWTEELYDTHNDPDNIHNLIQSPELLSVATRLRSGLREWQTTIYDAGLLPESECVKRAADNGITIYEMVRDPKLYDLPALLNAADLALLEDPARLPELRELLESADSGIRYWGIVGCFLLNDIGSAEVALDDTSHEVRVMAAWLLIRNGQQMKGLDVLRSMLAEQSYATLKILNVVDWIGQDGAPLMSFINSLKLDNYEERMQQTLRDKFDKTAPSR